MVTTANRSPDQVATSLAPDPAMATTTPPKATTAPM